ncbi:hypothetical protein [Pengzhenrongella sicca]|uniref:Uncharacterized protein n=1 Tax=Pengzhenrongella sicca TaxID=2819238 RepID=A0A8A4ZEP6_9MICO|nr:hypothetical protein [Pengzhenrongella sicca]QTE28967.1 hypothetical protein J4E96_16855 [Pengzhenrongella sicca]
MAPKVDSATLVGEWHRSRRIRAGWLIAIVIGCLASSGLVALWSFANHDHFDLLDDPVVANAADRACAVASTALSTTQGLGRAERIVVGNAAIDDLVGAMGALGPDVLAGDEPGASWIADWRSLQGARDDVALAIAATPQAQLVVPLTADGYPITGRMIAASGASCEEAVTLAAAP